MDIFTQQILRTNVSGMPIEWINYQSAAKLYYNGQIAFTCGTDIFDLRGGVNAKTNLRTKIKINSIIATYGKTSKGKVISEDYTPPLTNKTLFKRDGHLCLYCGNHFSHRDLSRDHVTPLSKGGTDQWANVVSACKRCNNAKAGGSPEQSDMQLIAIPFVPTHAEYIYLQGKTVLADQMEFLKSHFPRKSPLRDRLKLLFR
ncbi:MAG: HNH endonuclease [Gammaproteobacteria bacterium]|nr:HNH endonuclease [Gammaproteobacteria bacterium]|tara:strand:- start:9025 stop:9627 length:603 start_codon:yes stop_codon:yes gene_type:complete